jgi:hypothetical protein
MAIAINTGNIQQNNLTGGPFTQAITVSAGSIIHVFVVCDDNSGGGGSTNVTCADSLNGSYTQLDLIDDTITNGFLVAQFCFINTAAGADTITLTLTPNAGAVYITVLEITGGATTAIDVHGGQLQASPGTGTDAVTSGNVTSTAQPALVLGAAELSGFSDTSISVGTGFASAVAAGFYLNIESKRVTATGTQAATFTTTAGTVGGVNLVAVYDEAGGGGGGGTQPITAAFFPFL